MSWRKPPAPPPPRPEPAVHFRHRGTAACGTRPAGPGQLTDDTRTPGLCRNCRRTVAWQAAAARLG